MITGNHRCNLVMPFWSIAALKPESDIDIFSSCMPSLWCREETFSRNLLCTHLFRNIYNAGENMTNFRTRQFSFYICSWWYTTTFTLRVNLKCYLMSLSVFAAMPQSLPSLDVLCFREKTEAVESKITPELSYFLTLCCLFIWWNWPSSELFSRLFPHEFQWTAALKLFSSTASSVMKKAHENSHYNLSNSSKGQIRVNSDSKWDRKL